MLVPLLLFAPLQTTWIVDASAAGPGQGTAADPYASVAFALQQPSTVAGDSLLVLPGTYNDEAVDFLGKTVAVRSQGGSAVTRLIAGSPTSAPAPVVRVANGEGPGTLVEGFTLEGNVGELGIGPFGAAAGGSVVCVQSNLELRDVVITGGAQTNFGGGIYVDGGSIVCDGVTFDAVGDSQNISEGGALYARGNALVRVAACRFEGCAANFRGAAMALDQSISLVRDTVFEGNQCFDGSAGAIASEQSTLRIEDTRLLGNRASFAGGAIFARFGNVTLIECEFDANEAGDLFEPQPGGAVDVIQSNLAVTDCVFTGNRGQFGGALRSFGAATVEGSVFEGNVADGASLFASRGGAIEGSMGVLARRCIFVGNTALDTGSGGGAAVSGDVDIDGCTFVDNAATPGTSGTLALLPSGTVTNCIVVGGGATPVAAASVRYSIVEGGFVGTGNLDVDPEFWDAPSDLRLLPSSPAVDSADPASSDDPDGTPRDRGALPFDPTAGTEIGTTTCIGNPHSSAAGAALTVRGETDVAADRVTLHVEELPPGSVGFFLTSRSGGSQPLGNGSQGTLCLGGQVLRFSASVLTDRGTGVVSFRPRVASFPQGNVVLSGDTWLFQYWFRDLNPQPTSNTSSATQVVFQ